VRNLERLTLAHLWVAFLAFTIASFFGVWQMWARGPLPAPFFTPERYFLSVTAHGEIGRAHV
jgi:cytochrome c oxidase subunit I